MPQPWWIDAIGAGATGLTTLCMLPQAWQCWRSCDTRALSLGMFVLFTLGTAFWLWYGILLGSRPMMIGESITTVLCLAILGMKLRWK